MAISGVAFAGTVDLRHEVRNSLETLKLSDQGSVVVDALGRQTFGAVNQDAALWSSPYCQIAFTGMLYDPGELMRSAGLASLAPDFHFGKEVLEGNGAARLALAVYERWGDEFARHLDGNFSFAVFDERHRRLLLGRDAMAQQTMYYARLRTGVCFSSELDGLRDWPGVDNHLDEEALALGLSMQPDMCRTLLRGIHTLPGGHVLILQEGKSDRVVRYWNPASQAPLRVRDRREYAEGLRACMERAVEIRLPKEGRVGSMLSSGFDSAGVTAIAARALARQNRSLTAYTSAPSHNTAVGLRGGRFADEWPLASEVARMYPNIEHIRIASDGADWFAAMDHLAARWGAPSAFLRNIRWFYAIWLHAAESGVHTLLEGSAGNLTASYEGYFGLYDLRRRGRWWMLLHALRQRHTNGQAWRRLLLQLWMPEANTLHRIHGLLGRRQAAFFENLLLRPAFYASTGLPPLKFSPIGEVAKGDRTNGSTWRFAILQGLDSGTSNTAYRRSFGITRADPTADRHLVEFCMSVPDEAFAPGGVPRQLYRDALRDLLPASLLNQSRRGMQASDFVEMFDEYLPFFRQEVERIAASPLASRVLDVERMREMLDRWPAASRSNPVEADKRYDLVFGGAVATGRFLRHLEEGRRT